MYATIRAVLVPLTTKTVNRCLGHKCPEQKYKIKNRKGINDEKKS